jgi:hypothetical protein
VSALASPDAPSQDLAKWEQVLKEAGELQAAQPQAVAEKLAPLLTELRQLREGGALTPEASRILQDALLLAMRTQGMMLLPEAQIIPIARELLVTNPRIEDSLFNPRERIMIGKIRSAETGRLAVQTTPPGAALLYSGSEFAKTPAEIPLIAGSYRFRVRMQGYLDSEFDIAIQPTAMLTETRTLRRRAVEIPVAVNVQGARVLLNGKSIGVSQEYKTWISSLPPEKQQEMATVVQPWEVDRATGSFFRLQDVPVGEAMKVEFQAGCYQPVAVEFTVPDQDVDWTRPIVVRPELRRVDMKRDTGFLEVSSTPSGAEVWLDGILQGQTPMGKDVCSGSHRVQVWHLSGQLVQEVTIRRGQASKVAGDLKPAITFLGIYAQPKQGGGLTPVSADWEAAARRIALRSTAFIDTQIAPEDIDALRKKGTLPVETLLQDNPASSVDTIVRRISAEAGRADLLLVGARMENRYVFRLYNTIHPIPDLIEVPALNEAGLDFLLTQLNRAGQVADRMRMIDLGIELMDSPRGLLILNGSAATTTGRAALAPGAVVRTIDQKGMTLGELQAYLRTIKAGQKVTLEVQTGKDPAVLVPVTVRQSGAEYPWSTPDGFANSVLAMMRHLLERDPLSDEAKFAGLSLARGLMAQKEWKLALEYLAKGSLEPRKSGICPGTVLYYQGRCYEELGDRAQAESYYTRARDYVDATIGMPGGPALPPLVEQRIQALKK